jgi:hypothetical protein
MALPSFAAGAHWVELVPEAEPVEEPINRSNFHQPTVLAEDAPYLPPKYNYPDKFDRPVFTGQRWVPEMKNGKIMRDKTRKMLTKKSISKKGGPQLGWINRHALTVDSSPANWFQAFFPTEAEGDKFCVKLLAVFSNAKTNQMGAGATLYPDFVEFTARDIEKFIGLYILNGLNPSPDITMKFKSQYEDQIQGNDFVWRNFKPLATRKPRWLKAFFVFKILIKKFLIGRKIHSIK